MSSPRLQSYLWIGFFCLACPVMAQTPVALPPVAPESPVSVLRCGTKSPTADEIRYTLEVVAKQIVARNAGTTCIAMQPHIVLNDDGSGGISILSLNQGLANLNYVYKDAGIEFYWKGTPNYINNSDYVTYNEQSPDNDTEAGLKSLFTAATNAVNIYYVNQITLSSGFAASGYAYFPANIASSNTILMTYSAQTSYVNGTFSHELGHYFNLYHTHEGTEFGNTDANAENVPRSGGTKNCDTKGDLLCDTHADPKGSTTNCVYTGGGVSTTDINGVAYTPPVENIMSYYSDDCGVNYFTPEQYTRIAQGLATRLTHNTYTLQAAPQSVANPSGLTAIQSGSGVTLTWVDNATNDMGYLIERSTTSSTTGFLPLTYGGTNASATTYSDVSISNNITYYYRVKAANDNCNDYSNVATVTISPVYCTPTYNTNCYVSGTTPMHIRRFSLTTTGGTSLINNTQNVCSGGLADYTSISANVTANTTYNFIISLGLSGGSSGSCLLQNAGIWLDINGDKDFEDANEFLGAFNYTSGCQITGNFTIPLSSANGACRLRVRSVNNSTNLTSINSCSTLSEGETEDYTLVVSGGTGVTLPVELVSFKAARVAEQAALLTWETASEEHIEQFVIEVSGDGKVFKPLTTVLPKGSRTQSADYQYIDSKPLNGVNYYRLGEQDLNGKMNWLGIQSLVFEDKSLFKMFPNPTTNDFELHMYAPITETITIQITDLLGRTVSTTQQEVQDGTNILKMGFPTNAANGWYMVHMRAQGRTQIARIEKSN